MSTAWQAQPGPANPPDVEKVRAVVSPEGDDAEQASRAYSRSSIAFPYADLGDAQKIAEVMHGEYGGQCTIDQLAASLDQSMRSGSFRSKISAAQMFGIVDNDRGRLGLTSRGRRIVDSTTRPAALVEAFLAVDLYRMIFEKHQGGTLPGDTGLQAEMVTLGVTHKQAERARQVFRRSAEIADFFRSGRERLVAPPRTGVADTMPTMATQAISPASTEPPPTSGVPNVHPLLAGLMQELPSAGQDFPSAKREDWLRAAEVIFRLVYGKDDDGKPVQRREDNAPGN